MLEKLEQHILLKTLLEDAELISENREINIFDIELKDANFDEYEYYIHNTGFFFFHMIQLCYQLNYAVELLTNFNYSSKNKVTRDQHLIYNIENYIIRLTSLNERLLQLVNAIFHLTIDEKNVNERSILTNLKVSRTDFSTLYREFRKENLKYVGERNTIVHKHSYLNEKLRKIEVLYESSFLFKLNKIDVEKAKFIRKDAITKYIKEIKIDFTNANNECITKLIPILDFLYQHYLRTKIKLKQSMP
ncbi:hypothetical protein [Chryseobacterium sp.]|uniref:hypothetical protein n=1 Tax=Chryseobacterium sp. TaxID=1871047 RepID=UPI002899CF52|nr:hypothetical protein [Chryseobacterium sp.]